MASVPLSSLATGSSGTVSKLRVPVGGDDEQLVRRLAEIGFLPGEAVRVMARAPGREPIAVRIGRSIFALRQFEAAFVEVDAA